eukprot:16328571-Heterocapsa_arctica.AAC.1
MDKPALVGSSRSLVESLRKHFGALAGAPTLSAVNLGVDYSMSRRAHGAKSKSATRIKQALKRRG